MQQFNMKYILNIKLFPVQDMKIHRECGNNGPHIISNLYTQDSRSIRFTGGGCLLFNDGHVLQLWSETVAVCTRMNDDHIITGDECGPNLSYDWGKIPEKISTRKLTRPSIEPGPAAWEVTMLPLDHNDGLFYRRLNGSPASLLGMERRKISTPAVYRHRTRLSSP